MEQADESAWAEGLQQGRPEAWLALYDAYAARLWRVVAQQMTAPADAGDVADVVQASLLAAAESAGCYDSTRGSIWAWLCGIARHQLALRRRKAARSTVPFHFDELLEQQPAGEPADLQASLESRELRELLGVALGRLSSEYSALLLDRYVDGRSAEAIAVGTGSTGQAIRSKLARARRALQAELRRLAPSAFGAAGGAKPRSPLT
jgi:RNA polymerase sigma-70 factor (ECF subfamily)